MTERHLFSILEQRLDDLYALRFSVRVKIKVKIKLKVRVRDKVSIRVSIPSRPKAIPNNHVLH